MYLLLGKTSLLKCLIGEKPLNSGSIIIHNDVIFAYNSQQRNLNPNNFLWKEIVGDKEYIKINENYLIHSRNYVAQFNFTGNQQSKLISSLSGGERNRVCLAKSLAIGSNIILLDEPTNDLDIDTLRNLEEALLEYDGASIVISHDRWFLDRIATHIISFESNGIVKYIQGNYAEYETIKQLELQQREEGGVAGEGLINQKQKKFKRLIK